MRCSEAQLERRWELIGVVVSSVEKVENSILFVYVRGKEVTSQPKNDDRH